MPTEELENGHSPINPADSLKSTEELAEEIASTGRMIRLLEKRLNEMTLALAAKLKQLESYKNSRSE